MMVAIRSVSEPPFSSKVRWCPCAIVLHCVHWQWTNNLPAAKLLKKAQNLIQDLKTPQNMNRRIFDNILINALLWQSSYPLAGFWILYYPRMKIRFKIQTKKQALLTLKGLCSFPYLGQPLCIFLPQWVPVGFYFIRRYKLKSLQCSPSHFSPIIYYLTLQSILCLARCHKK